MVAPCGYQYELSDGTLKVPRADCNWDKQAAIEYLNSLYFVVYYNDGSFN